MNHFEAICRTLELPSTPTSEGLVAGVPTQTRGVLPVRVVLGEFTAVMRAFVLRAPDRRHDEVYARLLRRNFRQGLWRFALDDAGDVFAVGEVAIAELTEDVVDRLFGALSSTVDEMFDALARTAFEVPDGVSLVVPSER